MEHLRITPSEQTDQLPWELKCTFRWNVVYTIDSWIQNTSVKVLFQVFEIGNQRVTLHHSLGVWGSHSGWKLLGLCPVLWDSCPWRIFLGVCLCPDFTCSPSEPVFIVPWPTQHPAQPCTPQGTQGLIKQAACWVAREWQQESSLWSGIMGDKPRTYANLCV